MKTVEIIFSPTGGTGKVANIISACWNKDVTKIDLSDIKIDFTKCIINKDDQVLIAMPSFGGRAPEAAIERLKKLQEMVQTAHLYVYMETERMRIH